MANRSPPPPELLTTLSHVAVTVGSGRIPVAKKALRATFEAALYAATRSRVDGHQTQAAEYFRVSRYDHRRSEKEMRF